MRYFLYSSMMIVTALWTFSRVIASDLGADSLPYDHGLSGITSQADNTQGEKLYRQNACIECHGPRGYSEDPDLFPKIAGLDRQYIINQLLAFQSGSRQNVIMSPVASMLTAEDIAALATYISGAP